MKQLLQKQVLLGPAPLRRAAATRVQLPVEAWMLRQQRDVRRSYCAQVLDAAGDPDLLAEVWMLRQPKKVRESYIQEVLQATLGADGDR